MHVHAAVAKLVRAPDSYAIERINAFNLRDLEIVGS